MLLPTEEHVMLLGLQAERAWAHAMELKQDATRSAGTPHRRAKNHVVRKFAKAASWGAQLEATCAERCLIDCVICCDCMMCCVAEDSCLHHGLHCLAHCAMCVFMPCMQAQAHHQIKMETNPATQAFVPVAAPYVMQRN